MVPLWRRCEGQHAHSHSRLCCLHAVQVQHPLLSEAQAAASKCAIETAVMQQLVPYCLAAYGHSVESAHAPPTLPEYALTAGSMPCDAIALLSQSASSTHAASSVHSIHAFPTEAREQQKRAEQAAKAFGTSLPKLKVKLKSDDHHDDCGDSWAGLPDSDVFFISSDDSHPDDDDFAGPNLIGLGQ